jgi:hypothetical protein
MSLYELRTYTLYVGKMAEAVKLYTELGYPALKKGGHDISRLFPGRHWHDQSARAHLEVRGRRGPAQALGGSLRKQGLRRRFCLQVPAPRHDAGGKADDSGPVGATSLRGDAALRGGWLNDSACRCHATMRCSMPQNNCGWATPLPQGFALCCDIALQGTRASAFISVPCL